tara:strand:- start:802 stop:924 length:123 start_codon:yes stop_codon:yes gene_type:complete
MQSLQESIPHAGVVHDGLKNRFIRFLMVKKSSSKNAEKTT